MAHIAFRSKTAATLYDPSVFFSFTGRKSFINSTYSLNLSVAFLQIGKHLLKLDSDYWWSQWICTFPPIHKKVLHLKTVDFSPWLLNYLTQENSFASFAFLTTYVKAGANPIFLWKICLGGKKLNSIGIFSSFPTATWQRTRRSAFHLLGVCWTASPRV